MMKPHKLIFSFLALLFAYNMGAQDKPKLEDLNANRSDAGKISYGIAAIVMKSCKGIRDERNPSGNTLVYRARINIGKNVPDERIYSMYVTDSPPYGSVSPDDTLDISISCPPLKAIVH